MKLAVFGATGFIGRHLCEALIHHGIAVSALTRSPDAMLDLAKTGVDAILGSLSDDEAIRRTASGADVVYNLAGALGKWGTTFDELRSVNVEAAERIVKSAAESGVGKVVHVSTVGISGPLPRDVLADEDYPPNPATDYQRTKLEGEMAASRAHEATGIPLVIVRPAFVYGPGDTHKLSLFRAVKKRRMALVNRGTSLLHPVFVDDLVIGLIKAAEQAPGKAEIYNLAGPRAVTTRTLVETIARELGVSDPEIWLPEALLIPLACVMEAVGRTINVEPILTRSKVKLLSENYAYRIEKAQAELGYRPVVDLPEGIRRTVEWYVSQGLLPKGKQ